MAGSSVTLEPEILYMIAERLIQDLEDKDLRSLAFETLLDLRETSKDFAGMSIIKAAVFKAITLYATEVNLVKVEETDFSHIGPFVKKITFLAYPLSPNSHENCCCSGCGQTDEALTESPRLSQAWLLATSSFSHLHECHINFAPIDLGDNAGQMVSLSNAATAPGLVPLFNAVGRCFSAHSFRIQHLDIIADAFIDFARRWTVQDRGQLDLTSLKNLTYHCLDETKARVSTDIEFNLAGLVAMLDICYNNLEVLYVGQESFSSPRRCVRHPRHWIRRYDTLWPELSLDFPALRSVGLKGVHMRSDALAINISRWPSLRKIKFCGTRTSSGILWKNVFDAICSHPNAIQVGLESVEVRNDAVLNACFDPVRDTEWPIDTQVNPQWLGELQRDLCLYLAGRIRWQDTILGVVFNW